MPGEKVNSAAGPSPREWGKRVQGAGLEEGGRTIPTRVGKTAPRSISTAQTADHPHASGENVQTGRMEGLETGPSPREWGKPI